jgi:hypothetical protein
MALVAHQFNIGKSNHHYNTFNVPNGANKDLKLGKIS